MALAVNAKFNYEQYFAMIPTGTNPSIALTEGFSGRRTPKPKYLKLLPFFPSPTRRSRQSPAQGAGKILPHKACESSRTVGYPLTTTDFQPVMEELKKIDSRCSVPLFLH